MEEDKTFSFEEAVELLRVGASGFEFKNKNGIISKVVLDPQGRTTIVFVDDRNR